MVLARTDAFMSRFVNLEFGDDSQEQGGGEVQREGSLGKDENYYFEGAVAAFQNGNFESALRLYSKVLEFNPQNVSAWSGQVRMLIELGEYREAKLWADKALERFPRDPELLAAKAVALARTGDLQEALAFSDAAIEERGDTPYIWLARGDVLLAREEQRADFCLEKALSLAPRDWFAAWLAARIRRFYRQFAHALKLLQRAVELNSGHFLLWLELGLCQKDLGLIAPARNSMIQAQQLNPGCQEASTALTELSQAGLMPRVTGWWRRLFNP
jgi:tetratricopeptide (TPR) repeat protein